MGVVDQPFGFEMKSYRLQIFKMKRRGFGGLLLESVLGNSTLMGEFAQGN